MKCLSSTFTKGMFYCDVAFVLYNKFCLFHKWKCCCSSLHKCNNIPSLSTCGANDIWLMIPYNLTPFYSTHKDVCVCPDETLKSDSNFTDFNWFLCVPSLRCLTQLRCIVCDGRIAFAGTLIVYSVLKCNFCKIRPAKLLFTQFEMTFCQMSESCNGHLWCTVCKAVTFQFQEKKNKKQRKQPIQREIFFLPEIKRGGHC